MAAKDASIRALATVTLDASALDELGPGAMDRLADLVAARLAERRALGEEPLLTASEAGWVAGVHPETVRRAIRSGALPVAGYVGQRPRLRRADIEDWIADGARAPLPRAGRRAGVSPRRPQRGSRSERVLGNALQLISEDGD
jgi:excisionase family DNA binding protein